MATVVKKLILTNQQNQQIRSLLDEIIQDPEMTNQYCFMEKAALYAQELPRKIREEFYGFKRSEEVSALLVSGSPVLDKGAGPSPSRHIELEMTTA
ncbi:hypothetical protein [Pseudomonas fluorescens]|uniref:Uncharacterized protein n=1 Tax=Pseudomonas fluorescens TaxID=294 RepID=A0A5E7V181_PSEFL|nr:hypothetical protein [Pseudomonas fluorescens]VVN90734.1 hypothetical protein PS833_01859 [Pseudomonas fluorescens]VVQ16106.1 hypothetical protein PS914_05818 [Pseudomonas fluorescens]